MKRIWCREINYEAKPSEKGIIEVLFEVRREDSETGIGFHTLKEERRFNIGVAVVSILNLCALTEQRIRFIKKQNSTSMLCSIEDTVEIFLGLTNIF